MTEVKRHRVAVGTQVAVGGASAVRIEDGP
jgi:hypothetical protein